MELQTIAFITEYSGVIGCPGNKRKLGSKMTKRTWKFKKCAKLNKMDHGGYSLVELMVVVVIMVILASVSIGVYNGYVKRAKSAVAYEKGHRIAEALEICEAEYDLTGNISISRLSEISGKLMKKPNDPKSALYPYVGEDTDDCTDFTVSLKNLGDGKVKIQGFTYTSDSYEITWTNENGVQVMMN